LIYLNIFGIFPQGLLLLLLHTFNLPYTLNLYYFDSWLNATPTSHLMCDRIINMMTVAAEWMMMMMMMMTNVTADSDISHH